MMARNLRGTAGILMAAIAGCASVPQQHARLDEARLKYAEAAADRTTATLAPGELREAAETLERAVQVRDTLGDSAVVDHLAYVARQKTVIAREVARHRAWGIKQ